ncbi:MAG: hypothetical protein AAGG51_08120 [Cyanobacteria bacterium P01_G01_bin.54]
MTEAALYRIWNNRHGFFLGIVTVTVAGFEVFSHKLWRKNQGIIGILSQVLLHFPSLLYDNPALLYYSPAR